MTLKEPCSVCSSFSDPSRLIRVLEILRGLVLGCEGCRLLHEALRQFDDLIEYAVYLLWTVERALYVRVLDRNRRDLIVLEMYTEPGRPSVLPLIGPARTVPKEAWGSGTVQLAKKWLNDCLGKHSLCPNTDLAPLPTRIIDVGRSDSEVHLSVPEGLKAQYVALSHCWGSHRPLETTSANLQAHMQAIVFDANSKTLADAVLVTRALGIRFLWIDSLCIIQDDRNDWAMEAGRMSQVYRNATVTISAEASTGAHHGLFTDTNKRDFLQSGFQLEASAKCADAELVVPVHIRLRSLSRFSSDKIAHASTNTPDSTLSTRAWVVQERLLSPRTLHFYEEELAWSCCSVSQCECKFDAGSAEQSIFKNLSSDASKELETGYELQRQWAGLVTQYSRKDLTYASDRLPAISGLAGLVKQHTHSKYFAGLWEFDIPYGLLWMSDHEKAGSKAITRFGSVNTIPSWSWASVIGPVRYLERHRTQFEHRTRNAELKPLLEYVRATATPKGPNELADIENATVTVTGQLMAVDYNRETNIWRPRKHTVGTKEEMLAQLESLSLEPIYGSTVEPQVVFDVLDEQPSKSSSPEFEQADFYFLRAAIYITGGLFASNAQENMCLLLKKVRQRKVAATDELVFTRVGYVLRGFRSRQDWRHVQKKTLTMI